MTAPAVINLHEIAPRSVDEGDIVFERRRFGAAAGTRRIGASWFHVPPGRCQMPVHVHGEEEEIFYVLAGTGLGWEKGEAYEVAEGDTIVHRPNGKPHTFVAGDRGLTLLAFDSGSESSLSFLPRAGVMWAGPRWVPLDGPHPFKAEALAGPLERPRPGPRPANVAALHDVDTGPFPGVEVRALGEAAGAVKAGLNHATLPPGGSGSPPHVHSLEEELFYVLAGSGTLRLGISKYALTACDIIARPPATAVAHSITAGNEGITYLAYGTREPGDAVYYPTLGKVRLRGLGITIDARPEMTRGSPRRVRSRSRRRRAPCCASSPTPPTCRAGRPASRRQCTRVTAAGSSPVSAASSRSSSPPPTSWGRSICGPPPIRGAGSARA
jgi:uncharacterized cupin superfamily protein